MEQSDYIVYVDESGDHGLAQPDPTYPIFVLAFCVFRKDHYCNSVVPSVQRLKFGHFGHDQIVLHEREIRKGTGNFAVLSTKEKTSLTNAATRRACSSPT